MKKKTTIRNVAKKAGVSIATVSFVLNKNSGEAISEKVRKRVWKAAQQLDYHPSATAAGLARRKTRNVAIIFYKNPSIISNHFYSFVVQGAVKQAIEQEYNLMFSFVDKTYSGYADLPKIVQEKNVEGTIFMRFVSPKMVADIRNTGVPVVTVDQFPSVKNTSSLQIDNMLGARLGVDHLVKLGHRRIAFMHSTDERPSIEQRTDGFREACLHHGLPFSPRTSLIGVKDLEFKEGYLKAKQVLKRKTRPTALFCANDEMAAGALRAAHELGLSVPSDLSVVGFDDIAMSNFTDPPLTTIGVDKEAMGRRAMSLLLELVEQKKDGPAKDPAEEIMPVQLVVRASTAPPRDGVGF